MRDKLKEETVVNLDSYRERELPKITPLAVVVEVAEWLKI